LDIANTVSVLHHNAPTFIGTMPALS
jgi:hypothetical protein